MLPLETGLTEPDLHRGGEAMKFSRQDTRRSLMWALAGGVAAIAAIVSYSHIYVLGREHGGTGTAARLLPLSVDLLILVGELMLLHEADDKNQRFILGWVLVWSGILATLAANVAYGAQFGVAGALIWGWPAYSFILAAGGMVAVVKRSSGTTLAAADNKAILKPDGAALDGWSDPLTVQSPPMMVRSASVPRSEPVLEPATEPVPEPPAEPVPAPAAIDNKATGRRGHKLLPPAAASGLLDAPPAEVIAAVSAGATPDQLSAQFPDIKPYRARQLVKRHRIASNGHNLNGEAE